MSMLHGAAALAGAQNVGTASQRLGPKRRGARGHVKADGRMSTKARGVAAESKRTRVQFDLPVETFAELEQLAERTGATSVNDFARVSLRFYRWYLEKKGHGYQLMLEKDGKAAAIDVVLT